MSSTEILRANTAVVDHDYRDSTFVARNAVLAPGTAVFINSYGEPTVKCYNGNPLIQGVSSDPTVTIIAPAKSPVVTNSFVNLTTGAVLAVPGKPDPKPVPGPNPTPAPVAKVDPALVKAAVLVRVEADAAKERAADAATADRIADTGLREARQRLDNLRAEQQRLIAIMNDPTKPLLDRLAARAQLNDQGPNGLSSRIVTAIKDAGAAAQNKDKADIDKAKADTEAADLDRQAREKEQKAGLPSPPATPQPRNAQQPNPVLPDVAQQPDGEQLVAGELQPDGEPVGGGEQQAGGKQQPGEPEPGGEHPGGEHPGGVSRLKEVAPRSLHLARRLKNLAPRRIEVPAARRSSSSPETSLGWPARCCGAIGHALLGGLAAAAGPDDAFAGARFDETTGGCRPVSVKMTLRRSERRPGAKFVETGHGELPAPGPEQPTGAPASDDLA